MPTLAQLASAPPNSVFNGVNNVGVSVLPPNGVVSNAVGGYLSGQQLAQIRAGKTLYTYVPQQIIRQSGHNVTIPAHYTELPASQVARANPNANLAQVNGMMANKINGQQGQFNQGALTALATFLGGSALAYNSAAAGAGGGAASGGTAAGGTATTGAAAPITDLSFSGAGAGGGTAAAGGGAAGAAAAGGGATAGGAGGAAGTAAGTGAAGGSGWGSALSSMASDPQTWGTLASTAASIYGGNQQAKAANQAALMQAAQNNNALGLQAAMYNKAQTNQAPWLSAGQLGLQQQVDLMGLGRKGQNGIMQALQATPGYQWNLQQGRQALDAGVAARGGMGSGKAATDAIRWGQGLASTTYGNALQNAANLSTMGQNTATNMGTMGANYANNAGTIMQNTGSTLANATLAGSAAQGAGQVQALNTLAGWLNPQKKAAGTSQSTLA